MANDFIYQTVNLILDFLESCHLRKTQEYLIEEWKCSPLNNFSNSNTIFRSTFHNYGLQDLIEELSELRQLVRLIASKNPSFGIRKTENTVTALEKLYDKCLSSQDMPGQEKKMNSTFYNDIYSERNSYSAFEQELKKSINHTSVSVQTDAFGSEENLVSCNSDKSDSVSERCILRRENEQMPMNQDCILKSTGNSDVQHEPNSMTGSGMPSISPHASFTNSVLGNGTESEKIQECSSVLLRKSAESNRGEFTTMILSVDENMTNASLVDVKVEYIDDFSCLDADSNLPSNDMSYAPSNPSCHTTTDIPPAFSEPPNKPIKGISRLKRKLSASKTGPIPAEDPERSSRKISNGDKTVCLNSPASKQKALGLLNHLDLNKFLQKLHEARN